MSHKIDHAKVFALARKHLPLDKTANARSCMADAMRLWEEGSAERARVCALRSLAYSVGILHADYTRAFNASGINGEPRLVS